MRQTFSNQHETSPGTHTPPGSQMRLRAGSSSWISRAGARFSIGLAMAAIWTASGCAASREPSSVSIWDPFGFADDRVPTEQPIRLAVVSRTGSPLTYRAWWHARRCTPWNRLQQALSRKLTCPVVVEEMNLFQLDAHFSVGDVDFAVLTGDQFQSLRARGQRMKTVARAIPGTRVGLIVTKASSDLSRIEDIKGRRFAFGPRDDPVLHMAAVAFLEANGVTAADIKRELVPPGGFQFHGTPVDTAREIAFGATTAGVIEASQYEKWPETGGRFFPMKFSKDLFRILGRTEPVDVGPIVAGVGTSRRVIRAMRQILLTDSRESRQIAQSIGVTGFVAPEDATD